MMSPARALATTVISLAALAHPAFAHPPGTTIVDLTLTGGRTYEAVITIDANALRVKQAAFGRGVTELVQIAFDGVVAVGPAETTCSQDGQTAFVRLRGAVPAEAATVTWRSSLVYGAYVLTIRDGRATPSVEWLQGPQVSAPHQLQRPADLAWRNHILFALALCASSLLLPRRRPHRRATTTP